MFSDMGIPGFAERARRELAATGETARKRTDDTRGDLTAQESQIALLASEGLTNPEIGARLFLSPRTIEWHLRRIYPKLGVGSRKELRAVLVSNRAADGSSAAGRGGREPVFEAGRGDTRVVTWNE